MKLYAVHSADGDDLVAVGDAAWNGRAAAMARRRQLSKGKQALNGGGDRTAAGAGAGKPVLIVHRGGAA
jgi:hypothetical protein